MNIAIVCREVLAQTDGMGDKLTATVVINAESDLELAKELTEDYPRPHA